MTTGLDLRLCRYSPGLLHLDRFESLVDAITKETAPYWVLFLLLVETTGLEPVTSCV